MNDKNFLDLDFQDPSSALRIKRREFLKAAGCGIFILFTVGDIDLLAQERRRRRDLPTDINAFLKIGEDGRVSCFTGKIEMGQGVYTSLAQMLADELDVALESVDMVMGDTDLCPWDMGTFGSRTTRFFGPPLRAAAAAGRQILLQLASEHLGKAIKNLRTENGYVFDSTNKLKRVSYADLVQGKKIERELTKPAQLKKPAEFKIMNHPILRMDAREKVTGKAHYAGDIRIPGMLYASILRPPAHGAKLLAVDLSAAEQIKDVHIVRDGDMIAVLHEQPDVAAEALSKIKAQFDKPKSDLTEQNIFDHLLTVAGDGEIIAREGDIAKGESVTKTFFDETYLDGYVSHAPIEPHTATIKIEGNKVTVWPSSQTPFRAKDEVAEELGISPDNVRIISPFVGGGFGGKTRNLQVGEAARLAKLTGKPVQVAWTREEEFFYDSFRPAAVVKIKSGLGADNKISMWDYKVYFAGERGSPHFYDIPHHRTQAYGSGWGGSPGSHPFATGAWRAPGNNTNTFARESHIDIMAAQAGIDSVEFRLRHLKNDTKMHRVLKTAAEKFRWSPAASPSGRGVGVACGTDAGTLVATIAEVEVDKNTGAVQVKKVVCAQDMGLAINPEGATIQMEGCITMGLGYALKEDIRFRGGEIFDRNFDTYEIPRFSWVPDIETVIIDNKEADAQGGGEPAIITMGAVIANAIFDATGARVFQLPMTAERILKGMNKG
jgi:nicotinate dehydrogenase subunit B